MASRRSVRKRWQRWSRWIDRCIALSESTVSTRGCERAYNRWARMENTRANRLIKAAALFAGSSTENGEPRDA